MAVLSFSADQGSSVLIASAAGLTVFVGFIVFYLRKQDDDRSKEIPGSLGWPILGEDRAFWAAYSNPKLGIYDFAFQRHKKYGSIFKTKLMGNTTLFVGEINALKKVMLGEFKIVRNTAFRSSMQVLGKSSLSFGTITMELHKRMRQVGGELFTQEQLQRSLGKVEEIALGILRGWAGQTVRVLDETSSYSFHIIGRMILSIAPGPELDKMKSDFGAICLGLSSMPYMFLRGKFYRAMMARQRMYKMILDLARKRETGEVRENDFLQFLVDRKQEGHSDALSDDQLFDFILVLMIAGFETTSNTLVWILKNLEEHPLVLKTLQEFFVTHSHSCLHGTVPCLFPEAMSVVQEEHRGVQKRRVDGEAGLAWEDTKNMPYTLQVIYESMRLSNPVPWIQREVTEDFKLNGDYKLKKGWRIIVDFYNLHHDPAVHKDPSTFNPSRFSSPMKPYAFMGFGAGPRTCLGINLAKMELLVFLHHLVTMYRWECVDKDYTRAPTIFAKLKSGYPIHVQSLVQT